MKNIWTKHLYVAGLVLLLPQLALGASLECPAPGTGLDGKSGTNIEAKITKFSFNNDEDFSEIILENDGKGGQGNSLAGWKLSTIDTTVFTFDAAPHKTGEIIRIVPKPLTATSDQLLLTDVQGNIKDAACWINDKPTASEQQDLQKLLAQGGWKGGCLDSTGLAKNTVFQRRTSIDTDTINDWEKQTPPVSAPATPATSVVTPTATVAPLNSTPQSSSTASAPNAAPIAQNEVIVTELLSDPDGSDDGREWIELKNVSDHAVSLKGWQLDDEEGGSAPYKFETETIAPESFLLLMNSVTKITLNNTHDAVRLINPNGIVTDQTTYAKTVTGKSYARDAKNAWSIADHPTPNEENEVPQTGNIQTSTLDGGTNTANATQSDASTQNNSSKTVSETSLGTPAEISEMLPNPAGTDTGKEWIEIHNKSGEPLNMGGWKIKTANGKMYVLPETSTISAGGYMSFTDNVSKLQLKNTNEEVWLIDPQENLSDHVSYDTAPENESFARITETSEADQSESIGTGKKSITVGNVIQKMMGASVAEAQTETQSESIWNWTELMTPGGPNPHLISAAGTVIGPPGEDFFQLKNGDKKISVFFDKKDANTRALLDSTLTQGAAIRIRALQTADHRLHLVTFQIASPQESVAPPLPYAWLTAAMIAAVSGGIYFMMRARKKTQMAYTPS